MTNKHSENQRNSGIYSLRQRYLFVSSIIVLLIFALAWMAQLYVGQSSKQYRHTIELRHEAGQHLKQLRDGMRQIEKRLEEYLWSPSATHRDAVHQGIDQALHYFDLLRLHEWTRQYQVERELGDFSLDLKALHSTLERVMEMRTEQAYKVPEFASQRGDLTQYNQHFRLAGETLRQLNPDYGPQLESGFKLWQRMQTLVDDYLRIPLGEINGARVQAQQQQLEQLHTQLSRTLEEIANQPQARVTPSQQHQLKEMMEALSLWQLSYKSILLSPNNSEWRIEIPYLKHTVEPHFEHMWAYIASIDQTISDQSHGDAATLDNVANTVAKALWFLCFFGLAVISVAYLYFQRTVLGPIAMVATALKGEADGDSEMVRLQVHNLETRHLIDAFDEMRQQVQDRQLALEHYAMHDSLTALPNRYHLMRNLQVKCENSLQHKAEFAVFMLGLDHFKEINDSLGQHTGDNILKRFGQRLRYLLRDTDTIARFAGDEFAVILSGANREEALYVARKIRSEMEHPIDIEGLSLSLPCSIGIALYPDHGQDRDELARSANIAMAVAKQHKTGIAFYEKRHDTANVDRISLAANLRQAIQEGTLHLCYQPQFSVHNRNLTGLEVLCRWEHPERGRISPEEFIPVAEHTGQIHALTEWVVTTALQQAAEWRQRGLDCGILAINTSVFNLHAPTFFTMLEKQLAKWKYPAAKLMLEITETAMMADPQHAITMLRKLRELGLKLSIDDYGTGFSSLAYLKQLPVDELKIDKSFVMDMICNENDAIIVRSTIDLAHNLGLKVVAEGVDTKEKQDLLEILDCDYMQGYHIGKPARAHQIEYLLPELKPSESKVHHIRDFR